jgi:excisionase family DNA binding protein
VSDDPPVRDARREEWLAVKELAEYWRVSPKTVYRMILADELPTARRVRGQWRILRTAPPRTLARTDTFGQR